MSLFERRLCAELELLQRLAERNPERIHNLRSDDDTFRATLTGTPAFDLRKNPHTIFTEHELRIHFPVHYPAVPMTLHLERPALHPNIHPENGFVCLWSQHRVSNTVEHALHKTVAILGWKLFNGEELHVMQPDALVLLQERQDELRSQLACEPLAGVDYPGGDVPSEGAVRRRRLS